MWLEKKLKSLHFCSNVDNKTQDPDLYYLLIEKKNLYAIILSISNSFIFDWIWI